MIWMLLLMLCILVRLKLPPTWCIFGSPGGSPGAVAIKVQDYVSGTELRPCGEFQSNLLSSCGGDAPQTDRTDRQQSLMFPHCHGEIGLIAGDKYYY